MGEEHYNGVFLNINLQTTISMKRSLRELSIDMIIQRCIFKYNQISLFPCFTFVPKTGMGLCVPKI